MVKRIVVGAALALYAGCGTDPEPTKVPPEEYPDASGAGGSAASGDVSGSRLRQQRAKAADGTNALVGWHDAERQENCSFTTTFSGQTWCLPHHVREWKSGSGYVLFLDAACSKPVVEIDSVDGLRGPQCENGSRPGTYVLVDWASTCASPRMFQAADRLSESDFPAAINVYINEDTGCVGTIERLRSRLAHAREIPMSSFVSATIETE